MPTWSEARSKFNEFAGEKGARLAFILILVWVAYEYLRSHKRRPGLVHFFAYPGILLLMVHFIVHHVNNIQHMDAQAAAVGVGVMVYVLHLMWHYKSPN